MYSVELREYQLFQLRILREFIRICDAHDLTYYMAYGTLIGAARHQGFIPWDDDVDVMMPADDYLKFREICKTDLDPDFYFQFHGFNPCNVIGWQRIGVKSSTSMPTKYDYLHAEWGVCMDIFPIADAPALDSRAFQKQRKALNLLYRLGNRYGYEYDARSLSGVSKLYHLLWGKMPINLNVKWFNKTEEKLLHAAQPEESEYLYDCFFDKTPKKEWFTSTVELDFEGMKVKAPVGYKELLSYEYGENWNELPPEEERVWHSGGGGEGFIVSLTEPYEQFLK